MIMYKPLNLRPIYIVPYFEDLSANIQITLTTHLLDEFTHLRNQSETSHLSSHSATSRCIKVVNGLGVVFNYLRGLNVSEFVSTYKFKIK